MLSKVAVSGVWPVLFTGLLAIVAGMSVITKSDVLSLSKTRDGVAWFETNKDQLAVMAAKKKITVKREEGKWRARLERQEGK
jgi:hypothetical protein